MSDCSTRRMANHDQSTAQIAEADDARFTIALAVIFHFERQSGKDQRGVFEVEVALIRGLLALVRIVADTD